RLAGPELVRDRREDTRTRGREAVVRVDLDPERARDRPAVPQSGALEKPRRLLDAGDRVRVVLVDLVVPVDVLRADQLRLRPAEVAPTPAAGDPVPGVDHLVEEV